MASLVKTLKWPSLVTNIKICNECKTCAPVDRNGGEELRQRAVPDDSPLGQGDVVGEKELGSSQRSIFW